MPDINLDTILSGANNFMTQAVSAGNDLFDISMRQAVIASEDAGLAKTIGANTQVIDSAKQNADLATQNAKIKGANALGTNLKEQGELLTGLSADVLRLMGEKKAALSVVREKQSVGLFDDPLAYILNQITLPDDVAKHNAINEELASTQANIQNLNTLTQGTIQTQNQLTESITQAAIKASADNTAAAAQMNANKATRDALAYNAQGVTAALNVSKEVLGTQFQVQNAINSQKHIDIALANLDLHRQEFDWRKEEKKVADAARAQNKSTDDYLLGKINDGLQRMGLDTIPITSPKAGNILGLLKSGAASGSIYAEALKISNDSDMAGGANILATSPSRAVELLNNVPGIKLSSAQDPVRDLLRSATQMVAQKAAQPGSGIDLKNPAARSAAIDSAAKEILSEQNAKVVPGDQTNVFNIPSLGSLINASPELQKIPVVKKLLMPAIATSVDVSDPNKVFAMVVDGVQKGTVSYQEAVQLTEVYQRAVKVNLEAKQLQSLGLNLSPKKLGDPSIFSYNVAITTDVTPSVFTSKQTVDMTNPFAYSRALNKRLASQERLPYVASPVPGAYAGKDLVDRLFLPAELK